MNVLFDETYASGDGKRTSRNIWVGYADIFVNGAYGNEIRLGEDFMDALCEMIKRDLSSSAARPTETNWYVYGSAVTQDAIGDSIRTTVMIREKAGAFVTNLNISDHNFAVHIDEILSFKAELEKRLACL